MKSRIMFCLFAVLFTVPIANVQSQEVELNNQIRREKFDFDLPVVMRNNKVDMWIHVMRVEVSDAFGAEELGSTSGIFVFTDRGGDRIERAVLGRRWGATQRQRGEDKSDLIEECGAYDIIHDPIFVVEQVGTPMTEYDFRFKGLREFVEARDPQRIAVNYRENLATWPTGILTSRAEDGISYSDYLLLTKELGEKYAKRLVSSEYLIMEYINRTAPSEIPLFKKMRKEEVERVKRAFADIVPGVTKRSEVGLNVFRRMSTGVSQRGRAPGHEIRVIERGDIVAAVGQGMFGYVLREGEKEPPPEIQKIWAQYLKIDKILAETIKTGLTAREIKQIYKRKFEDEGIVVVGPQLHMFHQKNNFPVYSMGFDPEKILLSIDCHAYGKGVRARKHNNMLGPRIGSYGPAWTWDIPLAPNHQFVLEYFFYMPSPTSNEHEDQYLFFWDHEEAIATEKGVAYFSTPQKKLYLIK